MVKLPGATGLSSDGAETVFGGAKWQHPDGSSLWGLSNDLRRSQQSYRGVVDGHTDQASASNRAITGKAECYRLSQFAQIATIFLPSP